jgi:hypothetical protein
VAFGPDDPDDDGGDPGDCSCDELPLLVDPLPVELPPDPFPFAPLTEPVEPEELAWLFVEVPCVEPGSALATPRAPATLTAPTPKVSADSRAIPRRRATAADLTDWAG